MYLLTLPHTNDVSGVKTMAYYIATASFLGPLKEGTLFLGSDSHTKYNP